MALIIFLKEKKELHIRITVKDSLYFNSTMPKMHLNPLLTVSIHTFELTISPVIISYTNTATIFGVKLSLILQCTGPFMTSYLGLQL